MNKTTNMAMTQIVLLTNVYATRQYCLFVNFNTMQNQVFFPNGAPSLIEF